MRNAFLMQLFSRIPDVEPTALLPVPLERRGRPEEIAALVSYLAYQDSGYVTGATIDIDAGKCWVDVFPERAASSFRQWRS